MSWQAKLYVWSVVLLGLVPIGLYLPQLSPAHISLVLIAAILAFLADIFEVEIRQSILSQLARSSIALVLFIAGPSAMIASVLGGTLPAEIVLRWYRFRQDPSYFFSRVAFNTSQILLSSWAAIIVLQLLGGHPPPYNSVLEVVPLALSYVGFTTTNISSRLWDLFISPSAFSSLSS
jgi:hypothetical protein